MAKLRPLLLLRCRSERFGNGGWILARNSATGSEHESLTEVMKVFKNFLVSLCRAAFNFSSL